MVEINSVVPEKKLKMLKSRRTTYDDGQKQIAIGHQSDSGDLKKVSKKLQHFIYAHLSQSKDSNLILTRQAEHHKPFT